MFKDTRADEKGTRHGELRGRHFVPLLGESRRDRHVLRADCYAAVNLYRP